jgi:plastocyanin
LYYTLTGFDRNGEIVSGTNQPVNLNVDDTVNFNVTMNSGNHPFYIKDPLGSNVILSSGTQGTTNTSNTGPLTWTPTASGRYYYICGAHSSMSEYIYVT